VIAIIGLWRAASQQWSYAIWVGLKWLAAAFVVYGLASAMLLVNGYAREVVPAHDTEESRIRAEARRGIREIEAYLAAVEDPRRRPRSPHRPRIGGRRRRRYGV
jgi:hypothetical protein